MKQILFLLLFPCLAMAQYQGNAGQKITLGEQTTADGLVYRGLAADTTRKPSVDTMAFILLDTNTNIIWQYKKAVNNAWTRVGGSISSGVTGVLPVANGGTGLATFTGGNRIPYSTSPTALTTSSMFTFDGTKLQLGLPEIAGNIRYNNVWNRRHAGGTLSYYNSQYTTIDTIVSNSSIFQFGSQYRVRQAVADNITNNGYALGLDLEVSTINSLSGYSGTINNMYGMRVQFGNQSGGGNSPTINNLYGLQIQPQYTTGSTTNLYALYIGFDGTGGSVTNNYGIYQATSNIRNYFGGDVGIGQTTPTARLHIAAGTTTKPLLRFNTGSLMTTPDAGAFEFNGNLLYFTPSTTRHRIYHGVVNTGVTLDFPSTNAQTSSDLTVTVTGAVLSDVVSLGVPNVSVNANSNFTAWVSATDIVTVRFNNYSSSTINPTSGIFKVFVTK